MHTWRLRGIYSHSSKHFVERIRISDVLFSPSAVIRVNTFCFFFLIVNGYYRFNVEIAWILYNPRVFWVTGFNWSLKSFKYFNFFFFFSFLVKTIHLNAYYYLFFIRLQTFSSKHKYIRFAILRRAMELNFFFLPVSPNPRLIHLVVHWKMPSRYTEHKRFIFVVLSSRFANKILFRLRARDKFVVIAYEHRAVLLAERASATLRGVRGF